MTAKKSYVFRITLCCLVLNLTSAAVLNCSSLSANKCKAKFSEIFDGEAKAVHNTYAKNVLGKYVETYHAILAELPENDKHREPISKKVEELTTKIDSLNQGHENVEDTAALMSLLEENFEPDFKGIDFDPTSKMRYKKLKEAHANELTEYNTKELSKIYDNIMNLWFQLYGGLRKSDLEANPEFVEINTVYKGLKAINTSWKSMLYWGAVEKSTEFLKLQYYQKILDEIHKQVK